MMSAGWLFLGAMIIAYGVANLLQSIAATRTTVHHTFDPGLLLRLAGHRAYLVGLVFQILGFVLAFLARSDLPLFLVQASVAAGLGVTAVLGVALLKWRLPLAEVGLIVVLFGGITALVVAAEPAPARPLPLAGVLALALSVPVIGVLGAFAARLHGAPGSVALGSLAGIAFSAAAVAARPLASLHSVGGVLSDPLLYLLIVHSIVGQLLLGLAMQRGSTTAAVAAMDAAGAVPAAVIGLLLLGDRIWPGREWLATLGFVVTLLAVIGLTRYAEPQHHHEVAAARKRVTPPPAPKGNYVPLTVGSERSQN
ncbi:multidrug transporter EmrE-like cation transporter [Catenuloplanes niger]|uniref:Multidrug transporter EmrE-like cation transporter n=2 Tax=Micromonosporaceae TaxID=28056 RepID=A0AAE3ZR05_9ACTN|nr:multidrug transporter EmrE-like cation transporter [Catenuloplanes niger]